jgi:4-amino-4-deoxy-L-arabinose transferase-like glycosyltransferase
MLGPPVAALTGIGLSVMTEQVSQHRLSALLILITGGMATLAFQIYVINAYPELRKFLIPALVLTGITGLILLLSGYSRPAGSPATQHKTTVWIGSLMLAPFAWAILTTFNPPLDMILPRAGLGPADDDYEDFVDYLSPDDNDYLTASIITDYLQPRTEEQEYLLATWKAFDASPFILETGRPVMIMGGFTGLDPVMEMEDVIASVEDRNQRYFLFKESNPMEFWFDMNCVPVEPNEIELETGRSIPSLTTDPDLFILYDCTQ